MSNVVLIHGCNWFNRDKNTTDLLIPYLELRGFKVWEFDYSFNHGFHRGNLRRAERLFLRHNTTPHLNLITHSNGATIASIAISLGLKVENLIMFSPALDRECIFPPSVKHIYCIHNVKDWVPTVSKYIPHEYYGEMGRYGCKSLIHDSRIKNINADEVHEEKSRIYPHGDYFTEKNLFYWEKQIDSWLK